jgi:hypothetical protein
MKRRPMEIRERPNRKFTQLLLHVLCVAHNGYVPRMTEAWRRHIISPAYAAADERRAEERAIL